MSALNLSNFVSWGDKIKAALLREEGAYEGLSKKQIQLLLSLKKAQLNNGWFEKSMVKTALLAVADMLAEDQLEKWAQLEGITFTNEPKEIGVIMAGNIPAVGFHDFLSVLITGHKAIVKTSKDDAELIPALADLLIETVPEFEHKVEILEKPRRQFDAVIATGSNNSARYFEQYFGEYPNIIRKSRTSVAVLTGEETVDELKGLAKDMFTYYGLGCRNVSKIYLPKGYEVRGLITALKAYEKPLIMNSKYQNNLDYYKSIYIINKIEFLDAGPFLFKEDEGIHSPIGTTYYEFYDDLSSLQAKLAQSASDIQCQVGRANLPNEISLGAAQQPLLWDYADGVNTISFLKSLS